MSHNTNSALPDDASEKTIRDLGENIYRLSACQDLAPTGESTVSHHETLFADGISLDQSLLSYLKPEIDDPGMQTSQHHRQMLDEVSRALKLRIKENGEETLNKCAQLLVEDKQLTDQLTVKCNSAASI